MTNTRQFNKMYSDLLGTGLSGDEIVAITVIQDRMYSSITRKDFFDKKKGRHYVIYTRKELANDISVTEKTAGNIINKLVDLGYLTKKKQFSKADKLFIPDFNEEMALAELSGREDSNSSMSVEITPLEGKKLHSNQTDLNQTNTLTSNTVNTGQPEKKKEVVQEDNEVVDDLSWIASVANGYSMDSSIPEVVAKYSKYYESPSDFRYQAIGVISNVRAHIANKFGVDNSEKSQFDSNANFGSALTKKLKSVFIHMVSKKISNANKALAYLNTCMQEFFTKATGNAMAVARPAYAPNMAVETQQLTQPKEKKQSIQPEWLDNNDDWAKNQPEVTEEDRKKVAEMLKNFA